MSAARAQGLRSLFPSILATSATRGLSLAASLITLTLTARALGPEGRGVIAGAMTWMNMFATFGGLSLGPVILNRASRAKGQAWMPPVFGAAIGVTVLATLLSWGAVAVMITIAGARAFGGTPVSTLCVAFGALPFYLWEIFGSTLLISINHLGIYNRAQVVGRLTGIACLVAVLWLRANIELVLVTMCLSQAIVSLTGVKVLWKASRGARLWQPKIAVGLIGDGLKLHLTTVGALLISNANLLAVNQALGSVAMGHFQFATQLIAIMLVLPQAAATALTPRLAAVGADAAWRLQRRLIAVVCSLMVLASAFAALAAPVAIPRVSGRGFTASVAIFQWLLIPMQGSVLSVLLAPQIMARGMFWTASICTAIIGTLSVAVSLILVPRSGVHGAIVATFITQGVLAVVHVAFFLWFDRTAKRRPALAEVANV